MPQPNTEKKCCEKCRPLGYADYCHLVLCPCHLHQEKKCELDCHDTHIGHAQHCETSDLPPYHPLPQESEGGWEKKFDEKFLYWVVLGSTLNDGSELRWNVGEGKMPDIKSIKSFIRSLLSSQAQEIWELAEGVKIEETQTNLAHSDYDLRSYNASLTALQQQLKEKYIK